MVVRAYIHDMRIYIYISKNILVVAGGVARGLQLPGFCLAFLGSSLMLPSGSKDLTGDPIHIIHNIYIYIYLWVLVKIMVPFWVLSRIRHLVFRGPRRKIIILTTTQYRALWRRSRYKVVYFEPPRFT